MNKSLLGIENLNTVKKDYEKNIFISGSRGYTDELMYR